MVVFSMKLCLKSLDFRYLNEPVEAGSTVSMKPRQRIQRFQMRLQNLLALTPWKPSRKQILALNSFKGILEQNK
jgi:hypothetical protein